MEIPKNEQLNFKKPTLSAGTLITCDKCGESVFSELFKLVKISKFLTGSEKDQMIPIPVIVCSKCGHVMKDSVPKELKELEEKKDSINDKHRTE